MKVATIPVNKLAPTARPSGLQPVSPNNPCGESQAWPNGPTLIHAGSLPEIAAAIGINITQAQTKNAATTPTIAARGGVCGRHTAKPSAGASVASAEKETAPISAKASLPLSRRL